MEAEAEGQRNLDSDVAAFAGGAVAVAAYRASLLKTSSENELFNNQIKDKLQKKKIEASLKASTWRREEAHGGGSWKRRSNSARAANNDWRPGAHWRSSWSRALRREKEN